MKNIITKFLFIGVFILFGAPSVWAQDGGSEEEEKRPTIQFNGLGRTVLSRAGIEGDILTADTNTIDQITNGEFLLDLQVNARPNKTSEVQTILRLRNEFGGFFGAGQSIEVRELWARGIIVNFLKYRVGDMDIALSPYTLFSPDEEGFVNEPALFKPQKQVIHYEQFYTDENTRRLQGGQLEFGLNFGSILEDMEVSSFVARIRGTDFFNIPNQIVTGGKVNFSSVSLKDSTGIQADVGLNLVYLYDDLQSGEAVSGIRNTVYSIDYDVSIYDNEDFSLNLSGESGRSTVANAERITDADGEEENVRTFEEDDTFADVGLTFKLKKHKLEFSASYIDVGPEFFSSGAQSKRVEFGAEDIPIEKEFYDRIGTENFFRQISLFDISRDRAIYTFRTTEQLMDFDPRYNNTLPYGDATPNREGFKIGINYGEKNDNITASFNGAFLSELRGQGTNELKDFTLLKATADVNVHQFLGWKNKVKATFGIQRETTERGGVEVEQIDLSSTLIDLGLEFELFSKFEILLGAKLFESEGNEFVPLLENFNDVLNFPTNSMFDDEENLLGIGIKYEFKKDIYLTLQYQTFSSVLGTDNLNNYDLQQLFVLYNMEF